MGVLGSLLTKEDTTKPSTPNLTQTPPKPAVGSTTTPTTVVAVATNTAARPAPAQFGGAGGSQQGSTPVFGGTGFVLGSSGGKPAPVNDGQTVKPVPKLSGGMTAPATASTANVPAPVPIAAKPRVCLK